MVKDHKLTTRFGREEYVVQERKGNEVTVCGEGKVTRRHVTQVKRVPKPCTEVERNEEKSDAESVGSEGQEDPAGYVKDSPELGPKVSPLKLTKKDGVWYSREPTGGES